MRTRAEAVVGLNRKHNSANTYVISAVPLSGNCTTTQCTVLVGWTFTQNPNMSHICDLKRNTLTPIIGITAFIIIPLCSLESVLVFVIQSFNWLLSIVASYCHNLSDKPCMAR